MATGPADEFRKNHIISWRKTREFLEDRPEGRSAKAAFAAWYEKAERTQFRHLSDVRNSFGTADQVGGLIVFDIGGNKYRLIAEVIYHRRAIEILDSLIDLGPGRTPEEEDYLLVLGLIVEDHESRVYEHPELSGPEMLRYSLEQAGLTRAQLAKETGISAQTPLGHPQREARHQPEGPQGARRTVPDAPVELSLKPRGSAVRADLLRARGIGPHSGPYEGGADRADARLDKGAGESASVPFFAD